MYQVKKILWPILILIDLIGYILFFWKKLTPLPKKPKKVLFIRMEHIGDMIMATPAFETYKKNNPSTQVHVLCRNLTVPIIKNNPYVDEIKTYDAPWFAKRTGDKQKSFFSIVKELRQEKYDAVFEMHGSPQNIILCFLISKYTIGYGVRGLGFLLNKTKFYEYESRKHIILHNLSLIEDFCNKKYIQTSIFTDSNAKKNAMKIIKKYKLKNYVIISPFSGRADKDLTDKEVFAYAKGKNKIVFAGSKNERAKNEKYMTIKNSVNLCGETDLLTLVELVRHAKEVYAPDTGIIHIANAVRTKYIAVYKTNTPEYCGYFGNNKNIVQLLPEYKKYAK